MQRYRVECLKSKAQRKARKAQDLRRREPVPASSWTSKIPHLPGLPSNNWCENSLLCRTVEQAYDDYTGTATKQTLLQLQGETPTLSEMLGPSFSELWFQDDMSIRTWPRYTNIEDPDLAEQFPFELVGVDFVGKTTVVNGSQEKEYFGDSPFHPKGPQYLKSKCLTYSLWNNFTDMRLCSSTMVDKATTPILQLLKKSEPILGQFSGRNVTCLPKHERNWSNLNLTIKQWKFWLWYHIYISVTIKQLISNILSLIEFSVNRINTSSFSYYLFLSLLPDYFKCVW